MRWPNESRQPTPGRRLGPNPTLVARRGCAHRQTTSCVMRVLPSSGREWLSFVLFPFKAYTVLAVIIVFIWGSALSRHSQATAVMDAGLLVILGYLISAVVLFVGGLVQAFAGPKGSGLVTLLFAGVALIIAFWLAPMFAFA